MKLSEIRKKFGPEGIQDYAPAYGRLGAITDDTQMTLFTAEGMLRGFVRGSLRGIGPAYASVTTGAYQRWLRTQGLYSERYGAGHMNGWLISHPELHHQRAPGNTCIAALKATSHNGQPAENDSKGCGTVMRIAPVGLYFATWALSEPKRANALMTQVFEDAVDIAGLTHGHPTGKLAAGFLAVLIFQLAIGIELRSAIEQAISDLTLHPDHEETLTTIKAAISLAAKGAPCAERLEQLGGGWVAEEALAIALYSVLATHDLEAALVLAVNHSGDSDSTGSIAGHIAGALYGEVAIPGLWLQPLELRQVIEEIAVDLASYTSWDLDEDAQQEHYYAKYPGG
jgi:ADP-ribosyl-[dinitrogen reductase] hydrolase